MSRFLRALMLSAIATAAAYAATKALQARSSWRLPDEGDGTGAGPRSRRPESDEMSDAEADVLLTELGQYT